MVNTLEPAVAAQHLREHLKSQGIGVVSVGYDTRPDVRVLFAYVLKKSDLDQLPQEFHGCRVEGRKLRVRPTATSQP